MITRDELADHLLNFLACDTFNDYAPNGLQVEGKANITKICTAVTASKEIILQAAKQHADALLVHHGYFWKGENAAITGMKGARIAHLLAHNINLFAYHLPLDCHLEIGNNACIGKLLEINSIKTHTVSNIKNLVWSGTLSEPLLAKEFSDKISMQLKRQPLHVAGNDNPIKKIAWCSGGAQDYIEFAHELGVDAYLSGEISERTYYQAQEFGLHYFACGHHATERYGIQALGQYISERFNLEHQFIDSNNPI